MDRKMEFGRFRGRPVKKLILEHIGYIMWCLTELGWFNLNDEEQAVYDAVAISIVKHGVRVSFPTEKMTSLVKNKEALAHLETPLIMGKNWRVYFAEEDRDSPIVQSVLAYINQPKTEKS